MTVNIEIEPDANEENQAPTNTKLKLQARKALDGSIIVTDHPDIDIVIMPEKMKIVAFAKKSMDDSVYATQSRLFEYLFHRGVVSQESIKGGNVYSSLEGTILSPKDKMPIDETALFVVGKFLEEERPSFMYEKAVEEQEEERLLEPDAEDSTELGEIPHAAEKGSIKPHQTRRYIQSF
jgi:hypothetical protein